MASDGVVRKGTGKVLKHFRIGNEPMTKLKDEISELSDADLEQLVTGIENETFTY